MKDGMVKYVVVGETYYQRSFEEIFGRVVFDLDYVQRKGLTPTIKKYYRRRFTEILAQVECKVEDIKENPTPTETYRGFFMSIYFEIDKFTQELERMEGALSDTPATDEFLTFVYEELGLFMDELKQIEDDKE